MLGFIFELVVDLILDALLWKNSKMFLAFLAIVGLMVVGMWLWKP